MGKQMNNQIDVLALQATDSKGGLDRHKFAELIIRECVTVLEKYSKANMESDSWVEMIDLMQRDLLSILE